LDFEVIACCICLTLYPLRIQVGGQLMDFIIVLHGPEAVQAFSSRMHFSLGAGVSASAGPIGRVLEADLRAGDKGSGVCYTYSCSKGINFVLR
jgi:SH3 domain-containing YSC84-like protein 1